MNLYRKIIFAFVIAVMHLLSSETMSQAQEKESLLINELVTRHPSYSQESLIALMGSEDDLVNTLLDLRRSSKPPVLGPRCEKLLISFAHRQDVKLALLDDVRSDLYFGLTSIVLSSLPDIADKDFRNELASEAIGNSKASSTNVHRYKAIISELPSKTLK